MNESSDGETLIAVGIYMVPDLCDRGETQAGHSLSRPSQLDRLIFLSHSKSLYNPPKFGESPNNYVLSTLYFL